MTASEVALGWLVDRAGQSQLNGVGRSEGELVAGRLGRLLRRADELPVQRGRGELQLLVRELAPDRDTVSHLIARDSVETRWPHLLRGRLPVRQAVGRPVAGESSPVVGASFRHLLLVVKRLHLRPTPWAGRLELLLFAGTGQVRDSINKMDLPMDVNEILDELIVASWTSCGRLRADGRHTDGQQDDELLIGRPRGSSSCC